MILFPNAKINIGLNVVSKRPDGYHNLDMIMTPIAWCDILEIVPSPTDATTLSVTGRKVNCPTDKNLVFKAWKLLKDTYPNEIKPVEMHLHKIVPDGAGLGGGSSDAAFTMMGLNQLFSLGLSNGELCYLSAKLGADCPFFIYNVPMLCTGTGTDMRPIDVNLSPVNTILVVKPNGLSVSTAEAYGGVTPAFPSQSVSEITTEPVKEWRGLLKNDFEPHIFRIKPQIEQIKKQIYSSGAVYASMSGSGSAVYGLYDNAKLAEDAKSCFNDCSIYLGEFPFGGRF